MNKVERIRINDDEYIYVEIEDSFLNNEELNLVGAKEEFNLNKVNDSVVSISKSLIAKLNKSEAVPDEIRLDMGFKFGGELNFYLCKGKSEANIGISLIWKKNK